MRLIPVSEYAREVNKSVQTIYRQIKRGKLHSEIKDGVKYVKAPLSLLDNESQPEAIPEVNEVITLLHATIKDKDREIKRLHKEIKQIKKDKDKSYANLQKILDIAIQIKTPALPIIDAEILKTKKSKKKKKKKLNCS